MSAQPVRRFVQSAWVLLAFQLVAAICAVGITAWAAFQVSPLLEQRAVLTKEIASATREKTAIEAEKAQLELQRQKLAEENDLLASRLTRTRQEARVTAADAVRRGVNRYHAGDYAGAIVAYNEALTLDSENAYVLDLRSYSQFRANDLDGAISSVTTALTVDPTYVYGYSELARYACAAGQFDLAVSTYTEAKAKYADIGPLFSSLLKDDGEFARLCAPARDRLH